MSAVAKLIPKPPARVDNKKAKWGEPGAEIKKKKLCFRNKFRILSSNALT